MKTCRRTARSISLRVNRGIMDQDLGPSYPAARIVARRLEEKIRTALDKIGDAPKPDARTIEEIITTAFWASLLREEDRIPKVSIAFLPPEQSLRPIKFNPHVPL